MNTQATIANIPAYGRYRHLNSLRKKILSINGPPKSGTKLILVAILEFAGPGCTAYPSQETLAACTGMSTRSVRGHLKEAERLSWVTRGRQRNAKGRNWYHTIYFVHAPDEAAEFSHCGNFARQPENITGVPAIIAY